jgi:quercetin dioxygenase-like cupin family protein
LEWCHEDHTSQRRRRRRGGTHQPGGSARVGQPTAGRGWVQAQGGAREEVQPGDVIWFPPGVRNWHGATATQGMTHIAISESLDGKTVDWMEKVTDEQYGT